MCWGMRCLPPPVQQQAIPKRLVQQLQVDVPKGPSLPRNRSQVPLAQAGGSGGGATKLRSGTKAALEELVPGVGGALIGLTGAAPTLPPAGVHGSTVGW